MYLPHPLLLLDGAAPPSTSAVPVWTAECELPAMLERFFAEPPKENGWQWAEANVVLDAKQSPGNPGPYRVAKAPHTRFVHELGDGWYIAPDGSRMRVSQITIKKNSQGAWTEAVLNIIRKRVAVAPCNVLYVIDSITEARRISTIRLKPTLERCPATAQAMSEDVDTGKSSLTLNMRDMFIMFAGGGSIGAIANKPIELGVVDEADKIPRITGGHGHVVGEMKARFKTVPHGLLIVLSAPNEEEDITTQEYRAGSQHKLHVPCPHCNHFQEMVQERLRFDHCKKPNGEYDKLRVLRETYYLCEQSGAKENPCPDGKIYEHHKPAMVDRAEWRATNPEAEPGHISIESSDLFSLFPDASLGAIALDVIKGIRKPSEHRRIQRDRFGKEHRTRRAEVKYEDVLALKGDYLRGTIPVPGAYVAIGCDLQGDGPRWVKGCFAQNADSAQSDLYITDWGDPLSLDDLTAQAAKPVIEVPTGRDLFMIGGLVDEGYAQGKVLSFCLRDAAEANSGVLRFLPAKGRGNIQNAGALLTESARKHEGVDLTAYHFNDDKFKADLYISRIKELHKIKAGLSKVGRIWLPSDVGGELMDELMGEQLVPEINEWGRRVFRWKKTGLNNYGDATKLLLVLWHVVGAEVLAALPRAA
jgi:hypothetical protein